MTAKWNLLVDLAQCSGCYNCLIVAKDEYVGNDAPGYFTAQPDQGHNWIAVDHIERGPTPVTEVQYLPRTCNHCDDAPCLKVARDGAVSKRADGIVIIDPVKAKGQKQIVDACPYGAVWWNEAAQVPQAWPFDAHLLDQGWTKPRCVQACPTGAMTAVKLADADMQQLAQNQGLAPLHPEYGTKPRVWYKHLARLQGVFVAGTLETHRDGRSDCVAGATVQLRQGDQMLAQAISDDFGDFRLDLPAPRPEPLTLRITAGAEGIEQPVVADRCTYVGRLIVA